MEWTKSNMSGSELERRRREYIDAMLDMSRRSAAPVSEEQEPPAEPVREEELYEEEKLPEEAELPEEEELIEEEEFPEEELTEEKTPAEAEEIPAPPSESYEKPAKKTFGVFDAQQLSEAVRNGEMDGDMLREAAEILEEMSGKTEEMQRLAQLCSEPDGEEEQRPKTLNESVSRHNANCPRQGGNRSVRH